MKITYKNTLQDIIDLNLYDANNSPSAKNGFRIYIGVILFIYIGGCFLIYSIYGRVTPRFIIFNGILCIIAFISLPKFYRWEVTKGVIERFNKNKSDNLFNNITLILDDEGITKESDSSSIRLPWKGVQKVETTDKYIYIFLDALNVIVIPINAFDSTSEKDSFLQIIYKNINN